MSIKNVRLMDMDQEMLELAAGVVDAVSEVYGDPSRRGLFAMLVCVGLVDGMPNLEDTLNMIRVNVLNGRRARAGQEVPEA